MCVGGGGCPWKCRDVTCIYTVDRTLLGLVTPDASSRHPGRTHACVVTRVGTQVPCAHWLRCLAAFALQAYKAACTPEFYVFDKVGGAGCNNQQQQRDAPLRFLPGWWRGVRCAVHDNPPSAHCVDANRPGAYLGNVPFHRPVGPQTAPPAPRRTSS